jgi:hypothetical protein
MQRWPFVSNATDRKWMVTSKSKPSMENIGSQQTSVLGIEEGRSFKRPEPKFVQGQFVVSDV